MELICVWSCTFVIQLDSILKFFDILIIIDKGLLLLLYCDFDQLLLEGFELVFLDGYSWLPALLFTKLNLLKKSLFEVLLCEKVFSVCHCN